MTTKLTKKEAHELSIVESIDEATSTLPDVIETEDDLFAASDLIVKVRRTFDEVEARRTARTSPAKETIDLINEDFKKFLVPLKDAEAKLKALILKYADTRIESDLITLADVRKTTGDGELTIPIGLKSVPSNGGEIRFKKAFYGEVIDTVLLPAKYMQVDQKAIDKLINATDGEHEIPGVVIRTKAGLAIYKK